MESPEKDVEVYMSGYAGDGIYRSSRNSVYILYCNRSGISISRRISDGILRSAAALQEPMGKCIHSAVNVLRGMLFSGIIFK